MTGSVLYLRAFVACATGRVYRDPTVQMGNRRPGALGVGDGPRQPAQHPHAARAGGAFRLAGRQALRTFVVIQDTNPPTSAPPTTTSPFFFDFSSPTDGFAAAATYFHADSCFRMVQNLGFTVATYFNGTTFPVPVDHRGRTTSMRELRETRRATASAGCGSARATPEPRSGWARGPDGLPRAWARPALGQRRRAWNFGFAHSADSLAMIVTDPHTLITGSDRFIVFDRSAAGTTAAADRRADRLPAAAWGGVQDVGGYLSEEIQHDALPRLPLARRRLGPAVARISPRYRLYLIVRAIGSLATAPITPTPEPDNFADALMAADRVTTSFEGYLRRRDAQGRPLVVRAAGPLPAARHADADHGAGAPPAVDVYIDDGRNGEYQFRENFWDTDIWNRRAADGGTTHEDPVVGATNYAYCIIRNRGTTPAAGITVRGYHSRPMTASSGPPTGRR